MKKILLTLLAIIVIAGVLGGAGFAGYRYGYRQGVSVTASGDVVKPFAPGNGFGWNNMPMHNFDQRMGPGFHHDGFGPGGMMRGRGGFGFFSPLFFLARIAVFAFIIWAIYKLLTGWRISFTPANQKANTPEPKNE
jgi:hypothetical protein